MVLSLSLGGTTFMLKMESNGSPASLLSVKQHDHATLPGDEPNTTVKLENFTGTLYIASRTSPEQIDDICKSQVIPGTEVRSFASLDHYEDSVAPSSPEPPTLQMPSNVSKSTPVKHSYEKLRRGSHSERTTAMLSTKQSNGTSMSRMNGDYDEKDHKNYSLERPTHTVSFKGASSNQRTSLKSLDLDDFKDIRSGSISDKPLTNSDHILDFDSVDEMEEEKLSDICQNVADTFGGMSTRLHTLCAQKKVSTKWLLPVLQDSPLQASCRDRSGRLPLHIIANNESFITGPKCENINYFIEELIRAYPDAVTTTDDDGKIPFAGAISRWIRKSHVSNSDLAKVSHFDDSATSFDEFHHSIENFHHNHSDMGNELEVSLPHVVQVSFSMLSKIILNVKVTSTMETSAYDSLSSINTMRTNSEKVVDNIASLPSLLKCVLLIDDNMYRTKLMQTPVIQRIMLRTETVDEWLVAMLAGGGKLSRRAVDYFEFLSNLSCNDALGYSQYHQVLNNQQFYEMREDMIKHIADLHWILPSLFNLNAADRSRACSTFVVQKILSLSIENSSLISLMMFRFTLHCLLILTYSVSISVYFRPDDTSKTIFDTPWMLNLWICTYFLVRDDCFEMLMAKCWKKVFQRYLNFWALIEIASVVLTLATTWMLAFSKDNVYFPAVVITVGLIWLRLLGCLIGINMHLALFILSLVNIVFDLRWFLIVLSVTCAMFGHMVHIITRYGPGDICPDDDRDLTGDYCSPTFARSFLRAYAIIVTDIDLDVYRYSSWVTVLWVVFTMFGVIILLNVLIAIVNTSYNRSISQRHGLFGTARIPLLAKHYFLENKLIPRLRSAGVLKRYAVISSMIAFFGFMELSFASFIRIVYLSSEMFGSQFAHYGFLALIVVLVLVANVSILRVWLDFFGPKVNAGDADGSKFIQFMNNFIYTPMHNLVSDLFGINQSQEFYNRDSEDKNQIPEQVVMKVKEIVEQTESRLHVQMSQCGFVTQSTKKVNGSNPLAAVY